MQRKKLRLQLLRTPNSKVDHFMVPNILVLVWLMPLILIIRWTFWLFIP